MDSDLTVSLRRDAPRRMLDGFGRAIAAHCRYVKPTCVVELREVLLKAKAEHLTVTFRGKGRSYGDAALNRRGIVIDTSALAEIIRWDNRSGILEAETGVTIEQLWKHVVEDGYWPHVVPGTMHATLGGCVAMNVHGKNNSLVGPFGDYIRDLTLMTADGNLLTVGPSEHRELFEATVGGLGLLGCVVRVNLDLRRIESGLLRVKSATTTSLDATLEQFDAGLSRSDYAVGWVDAYATGARLGRSELHFAKYVLASEEPSSSEFEGKALLHRDAQALPARIFGLPREELWRFMRPFTNACAMSSLNGAKYQLARLRSGRTHLESHAAFAFLLDFIPDWRLAYGEGGFIQHQLFVPHANAARCLGDVLRHCQAQELVPHLAVLKRHRKDKYLLSHGLDGWSLALDFRVTERNRPRLGALTSQLTALVLDAGGRFYFAKDSVLRPADARRAFGEENVRRFLELKRQMDPTGLFGSDLFDRVFSARD